MSTSTAWFALNSNIEAGYVFETSVPTYQSKVCHDPEDHNKNRHRHENRTFCSIQNISFASLNTPPIIMAK